MRTTTLLAGISALLIGLSAPAAADQSLDCHDLAAISPGGTVVHPPFGEKDCGSCHAEHGDQERLVLMMAAIIRAQRRRNHRRTVGSRPKSHDRRNRAARRKTCP